MEAIVKEFNLDQIDVFDKAATKQILTQIGEKLILAQAQLAEKNRTNLPKLTELKLRKDVLLKEYEMIREESAKISLIDPIHMLEKRKNDAKTEGEYIDKILNRNIHEEFVNLMLNEIKSTIYKSTTIESILSDGLEQVSMKAIPGCTSDFFNNQANDETVGVIQITSRTQKICNIIDKCLQEVCTKVYPDCAEKQEQFFERCFKILLEYFDRINGLRQGKSQEPQQQLRHHEKLMNLPQFIGLLLNDLSFSIAFLKYRRFKTTKSLLTSTQSMVRLKLNILNSFIDDIKVTELYPILSSSHSTLLSSSKLPDYLERIIKKLNLFLSRLFGVLTPILVRIDLSIIKANLIKYVESFCWNEIILNLTDIHTYHIDPLITFSTNIDELSKKFTSSTTAEAAAHSGSKFECFRVNILSASLVEIINCYHQGRFGAKITERELYILIDAIFAYSPLKAEFLKELKLDMQDTSKSKGISRKVIDDNEEYF